MKTITILARTRFDRINGNSYFTTRILLDGRLYAELPKEYGYGDYYKSHALKFLADKRRLPQGLVTHHDSLSYDGSSWALYCDNVNVTRVQDLHSRGRLKSVEYY